MTHGHPSFRKGLLLSNLSVLLAGPTGLFGKTLAHLPIGVVVLARSAIAALSLFVLLRALNRTPARSKPLSGYYRGALLTGSLLAFHWFTFFWSIQRANVAVGILAFSTFPLFATFFEPLVFKQRLRAIDLLWATLAIGAMALIVPSGSLSDHVTQGALLGIVSGALYAAYSVANKALLQQGQQDVMTLTMTQNTVSAVWCLPALWPLWQLGYQPTLADFGQLLLLGTLLTAGLQVLFIASLHHIPARLVGMITCLEPLYGILLAYFILGEIPQPHTLIGGACLIATVLSSILTSRPDTLGRPA